ncbi:hypothetical protein NE237_020414 [Protea cynaroides]|uniref:Alliinase C-terminal domain-containing protein n=1 Tax=Protea cynaroides TaxID=273540 RepID=A0A9Q0HB57_9MAGN|nr:hypothetical protein NE237_020414 [Protea cynaroides]
MCPTIVNRRHSSSATAPKAAYNDSSDSVVNLNQGNPTMFETYWRKTGKKGDLLIPGCRSMSYFAEDLAGTRNQSICWFMEKEFEEEVRRIHDLVGNAVTEDRYIVVGTGSVQLYQAAIYAYALSYPLDAPDSPHPISVVCAAPYYSAYPAVTDYLKSGLYKWKGDANSFKGTNNEPYIELITSPNNPDGFIREPVVNRHGAEDGEGRAMLIHDYAYYWPQYTAITAPADNDIMLFTFSKSTGHAGSRIGWAVVKDRKMAETMTKFIELNTIGVSKDSQLRAAKILKTISDSCQQNKSDQLWNGAVAADEKLENFFYCARNLMAERWKRLRNAIKDNGFFSLPEYPKKFCNFSGQFTEAYPSFAWLKVEEEGIEDCASFLSELKILTRGGKEFGGSPLCARISMVDRQHLIDLLIERLSTFISSKRKCEKNGVIIEGGRSP